MIRPDRRSDKEVMVEALRRVWWHHVMDASFQRTRRYQYYPPQMFEFLETLYEANVK